MYQRVYKRYRRMLADAVNDEVFLLEKGRSMYFRETPFGLNLSPKIILMNNNNIMPAFSH